MNHRYLFSAFAAIALAGSMVGGGGAAEAAAANSYTITGDTSAANKSGKFVVWVPAGSTEEVAAAGTTAAASSGGAGGEIVLAEGPVVDGKFFLEGTVDTPRVVYCHMVEDIDENGIRMGPLKGQTFILEPGDLTLVLDSRRRFVVEGGHYNDIVYNSWKKSPDYLKLMGYYYDLVEAVEGETQEDQRVRMSQAQNARHNASNVEDRERRKVALNHEDPIARRLTLQSLQIRYLWVSNAIQELAEIMPDDPWVKKALAAEERSAELRAKARETGVGKLVKDFEAETLDGEVVSVSGAREDRELVLVEFWASWCGPCRTEIPHMKQAYSEYGPLGFEIFSFTIDDDREDWMEASEEEGLPWIDAGMGSDHPAAEAYGVTGVPTNFLVDAGPGTILARNLRQHKLDEALEKYLVRGEDRSVNVDTGAESVPAGTLVPISPTKQ